MCNFVRISIIIEKKTASLGLLKPSHACTFKLYIIRHVKLEAGAKLRKIRK